MKQLIEIQYFGCISYFYFVASGKYVIIEQYESFQKMSFRNRCQVLGAGKLINLSVPIIGGRDQKAPITEVLIDNSQPWPMQHWRTLESCYNKSPFFLHYGPSVKDMLFGGFRTLWELDNACFDWVISKLRIGITKEFSTSFQKQMPGDVADLRNRCVPANRESFGLTPYQQVFGQQFVPNLSILDLLFNLGPQAGEYLQKQTINW